MSLADVFRRLQTCNVPCGLQTLLGDGVEAWVGDERHGLTVKAFSVAEIDRIASWLMDTAERRYAGRELRRWKSAVVPGSDLV